MTQTKMSIRTFVATGDRPSVQEPSVRPSAAPAFQQALGCSTAGETSKFRTIYNLFVRSAGGTHRHGQGYALCRWSGGERVCRSTRNGLCGGRASGSLRLVKRGHSAHLAQRRLERRPRESESMECGTFREYIHTQRRKDTMLRVERHNPPDGTGVEPEKTEDRIDQTGPSPKTDRIDTHGRLPGSGADSGPGWNRPLSETSGSPRVDHRGGDRPRIPKRPRTDPVLSMGPHYIRLDEATSIPRHSTQDTHGNTNSPGRGSSAYSDHADRDARMHPVLGSRSRVWGPRDDSDSRREDGRNHRVGKGDRGHCPCRTVGHPDPWNELYRARVCPDGVPLSVCGPSDRFQSVGESPRGFPGGERDPKSADSADRSIENGLCRWVREVGSYVFGMSVWDREKVGSPLGDTVQGDPDLSSYRQKTVSREFRDGQSNLHHSKHRWNRLVRTPLNRIELDIHTL